MQRHQWPRNSCFTKPVAVVVIIDGDFGAGTPHILLATLVDEAMIGARRNTTSGPGTPASPSRRRLPALAVILLRAQHIYSVSLADKAIIDAHSSATKGSATLATLKKV